MENIELWKMFWNVSRAPIEASKRIPIDVSKDFNVLNGFAGMHSDVLFKLFEIMLFCNPENLRYVRGMTARAYYQSALLRKIPTNIRN